MKTTFVSALTLLAFAALPAQAQVRELTLDRAIELGLEHSPDLRMGHAEVEKAHAESWSSLGNMGPKLSVEAGIQYWDKATDVSFIDANAGGLNQAALAADLGCDIDQNPPEFGGVWSIPSGEQTADALRDVWPQLWSMPFASARGWKLMIVNEVEQLNGTVEKLWLDRLEDLPPRTLIVFTTNRLDSLPDRFVDRCTVIEFESAANKLAASARLLASGIWREETGGEIPADVLVKVMDRANRAGRLSFRRVVQALVPLIAAT